MMTVRANWSFQDTTWPLSVPVAVAWAWSTIYAMGSMLVAGVSTTLLLSGVTIWTGVIFWRGRARMSSGAAPVLAGAFILWGIHHLDYPLLLPSPVLAGVPALDTTALHVAAIVRRLREGTSDTPRRPSPTSGRC